jgi:hypothetical protein
MSAIIGDQGTVKKANYAPLLWPVLRGIALIVALWAFIPYLSVLLYGRESGTSMLVFPVASFVLLVMISQRVIPLAIAGDRSLAGFVRRLPWSLVIYCGITGMGYTWVCAFLWFSRRYAVFSGQVVGAVGLILALYAIIGVVVAWLTGGNWRTAFMVFWLVPCVLSGIVLRLHLLR